MTSPNHINKKTGQVKIGLFPVSHIAKSGLSLVRVDRMSVEEMDATCRAVASTKAGETPLGLKLCSAERIRGIRDEVISQSLCVVDDPVHNDPVLPDNPAHAIAIGSTSHDEAEILRIQLALLGIFGDITKLEQVHPD